MAFQSLRYPVRDDTVAVDLFFGDLLDCNRCAGMSPRRKLTESSEMFRRRYQCQYRDTGSSAIRCQVLKVHGVLCA